MLWRFFLVQMLIIRREFPFYHLQAFLTIFQLRNLWYPFWRRAPIKMFPRFYINAILKMFRALQFIRRTLVTLLEFLITIVDNLVAVYGNVMNTRTKVVVKENVGPWRTRCVANNRKRTICGNYCHWVLVIVTMVRVKMAFCILNPENISNKA